MPCSPPRALSGASGPMAPVIDQLTPLQEYRATMSRSPDGRQIVDYSLRKVHTHQRIRQSSDVNVISCTLGELILESIKILSTTNFSTGRLISKAAKRTGSRVNVVC